ncbi:uncharacterized protein ARB_01748 [Trichophyton benhamiae CBS 112371]|uniref:Uncharacterized protein n=1 Tax=Arthroderma benhamiae (strain ATCC MYA-4681 / CBS 112371) TaxID=663331 RepID=D4AZX8_ARTBC|nr:uncharacterized protein ARB_01748 [Trichophyton benhamiae CBS 112371]EFE31353.1 hypothetical protein ARB_01748 [Trichophyton benhamiae CBS 112371]
MIYGVRALILQLAEEYLTAEQEEEEEEMNAAAQADIKWLSIHSRHTPSFFFRSISPDASAAQQHQDAPKG